jgi:hypothetical protein
MQKGGGFQPSSPFFVSTQSVTAKVRSLSRAALSRFKFSSIPFQTAGRSLSFPGSQRREAPCRSATHQT